MKNQDEPSLLLDRDTESKRNLFIYKPTLFGSSELIDIRRIHVN